MPTIASHFSSDVTRITVSEGLRHLFPSAAEEAPPAQSRYFDAFLASLPLRVPPLATGEPGLDSLLDGGLRPGLWLVCAEQAFLATSFLDVLAWAAIDSSQTSALYSLRTGAQASWERLVAAFGRRIGDPLEIEDLRSARVTVRSVERARRLDALLVKKVFPLLDLDDGLPSESRSLVGFLTRVETLLDPPSSTRLFLLDGLPQLAVLLGLSTGRSVALLSETDDLLRRHGAVGAIVADPALEPNLTAAVSGVLELGASPPGGPGPTPSEAAAHSARVQTRIALVSSRWGSRAGETTIDLSVDSL